MTDLRRMIKKNAKNALSKHWGKAVAAVLVALSLTILLYMIEAGVYGALGLEPYLDIHNTPGNYMDDIPNTSPLYLSVMLGMGLLSLFITSPLFIGINDWFLEMTEGASPAFSRIFLPYGNRLFFRSVLLNLSVSIRSALWTLLFTVVPLGAVGFSVFFLAGARSSAEQAVSLMGIWIGIGLLLASTVFLSAVLTRYMLAPYLLCKRYAKTAGQAIRLSVCYTKGHRWEIFVFSLSFLPWLFLSLLLVLLPLLWVYPYMQMSFALFARYLIEAGARQGQCTTREFQAQ